MYLLTQAIRSRFRKYAPFSQLHRELPRVLLQLSTRSSIYGCGPWTWWVLGAIERPDDDWLFAGVMDSHAGTQAGAFSMEEIRRLDKRTWPRVRRVMHDPLLPLELLPIWRGVNREKPTRLMEFTMAEIANAEDEFVRECYARPLDAFDLAGMEDAIWDADN